MAGSEPTDRLIEAHDDIVPVELVHFTHKAAEVLGLGGVGDADAAMEDDAFCRCLMSEPSKCRHSDVDGLDERWERAVELAT